MKGKEAIDWKEGFPQALIGQGKTSSRKSLMCDSLNLCLFACVEREGLMIWRGVLARRMC
jgi:hypothetical protein